MKIVKIGLIILSLLLSLNAQTADRLTDENIAFIYESRADLPITNENLVKTLSQEYKNARDEFTQYELMKKIKPVFKKKLTDAKANNSYFVKVGSTLGKYDFKNNTFSTGFSKDTYIPFKNGYALSFNNVEDIANIKVAFVDAKRLSKKLQRNRKITAIIYIKTSKVQVKKVHWNHSKVLNADITSITILTDDGNEIISKNL
ncbi:DUF4852 domain-containing protein [Sulfurimonas sp.]|uniref:DUF4852 domain-containing protein n=1 Tax=Sulfurimonas sp. TaxID=2022749 RepID=UPI002B478675|nr:DUF4852 domain-containing protein [Sulfurimonas sp.]